MLSVKFCKKYKSCNVALVKFCKKYKSCNVALVKFCKNINHAMLVLVTLIYLIWSFSQVPSYFFSLCIFLLNDSNGLLFSMSAP